MKCRRFVILIHVLLLPGLLLSNQQLSTEDELFLWSKTFAELMSIVEKKYIHRPKVEEAMIKAMKSFMSLDSHSTFLDPKSFDEILNYAQGSFSGIGIMLDATSQQGPFKIIDVLPKHPAEKAGVKKNDIIVAIDNKSVLDMSYDTLIETLRGPEHTKVTLTLLRNTQLITVTIMRELIQDELITGYLIGEQDPLIYIALKQFSEQCPRLLAAVAQHMHEAKIKKLIIDLRDNPGGVFESALDCVGLFLSPDKQHKQKVIASTKNGLEKELERYCAHTQQEFYKDCVIIILVNSLTASAAEIMAGTLQHYAKKDPLMAHIIIMGEPTFGKGSVQEVIPLSNKCAVKLTTSLYYLPDDMCIQNKGITPDIIVDRLLNPTQEERTLRALFSSEKHLKGNLSHGSDSSTKNNAQPVLDYQQARIAQLKTDNQLQAAVATAHHMAQMLEPHKLQRNNYVKHAQSVVMQPDTPIKPFLLVEKLLNGK